MTSDRSVDLFSFITSPSSFKTSTTISSHFLTFVFMLRQASSFKLQETFLLAHFCELSDPPVTFTELVCGEACWDIS